MTYCTAEYKSLTTALKGRTPPPFTEPVPPLDTSVEAWTLGAVAELAWLAGGPLAAVNVSVNCWVVGLPLTCGEIKGVEEVAGVFDTVAGATACVVATVAACGVEGVVWLAKD
jgi:hypothetical protein